MIKLFTNSLNLPTTAFLAQLKNQKMVSSKTIIMVDAVLKRTFSKKLLQKLSLGINMMPPLFPQSVIGDMEVTWVMV